MYTYKAKFTQRSAEYNEFNRLKQPFKMILPCHNVINQSIEPLRGIRRTKRANLGSSPRRAVGTFKAPRHMITTLCESHAGMSSCNVRAIANISGVYRSYIKQVRHQGFCKRCKAINQSNLQLCFGCEI